MTFGLFPNGRFPFQWIVPLTVGLLVAPVAAGLAGTLLPALGYFPPLGGTTVSLEPWRRLLELPGLGLSVRLSLVTGLVTTAVSLSLVTAFCAAWHGTRVFVMAQSFLAPWLAVPHVAVAFGLAFLLAPSGWILRLLSPWATGFGRPPDWLILQDARGLSLMLGLIVKEVPYLLVMTLAALGQADAERCRTVARTLGYRTMNGWIKVVFPRVYPQIRLPVLAVLAYGMSVVDVAIILGPTTPAPLAVRLVRLFNDPDLEQRLVASAGGCLQLGLVLAGIGIWLGGEVLIRVWGIRGITSGNRGRPDLLLRGAAAGAVALAAGAVLGGLFSLVLWSVAGSWRFPDVWPTGLTGNNWVNHLAGLKDPLINTLTLAIASPAVALVLALGVLEQESISGRRTVVSSGGALYLPLLLPQVAFLFGAQIWLVTARLDGRWIALGWMHLVFVFPYVFLSLAEPYRAWDDRYRRTGLCLGASPARVLLRLKLPMLLRAILTAGAVGFAVSLGLYLPTLFAGGGRFPTLTTEAVTLSASGDNRLISLYALLQMFLPLVAFTLAAVIPAWCFRQRRGMQVAR